MKVSLTSITKAYKFIRCEVFDRADPIKTKHTWVGWIGTCEDCGGHCYLDGKGVWRHESRDD